MSVVSESDFDYVWSEGDVSMTTPEVFSGLEETGEIFFVNNVLKHEWIEYVVRDQPSHLMNASIHEQRAFLKLVVKLKGFIMSEWRKIALDQLFYDARQMVTRQIVVEEGNTFMYKMPLMLANGKNLPYVYVNSVDPICSGVKPDGNVFNDENVSIWMTTLVLCCKRRGYKRISDILSCEVGGYVKMGKLTEVSIYKKEPSVSESGIRVCLPAGIHYPVQRRTGHVVYYPVRTNPEAHYTPPHAAVGTEQLIESIMKGIQNGYITNASHTDRLVYYANTLYNYTSKNVNCDNRQRMQAYIAMIETWTS